jgi:hypothetical protein
MAKSDISWKRLSREGEKVEVYAHHLGDQWKFYTRGQRYDRWQAVATPPLEDWLALLDAIRRRIGRGSLRPEELVRVKNAIRTRFPEAEF